jgi:hypothetical protein
LYKVGSEENTAPLLDVNISVLSVKSPEPSLRLFIMLVINEVLA